VKTWRRVVIVVVVAIMNAPDSWSQSLMDARALGLGAYFSVVSDVREFSVNPAGIVAMRDWDLNISTYTTPSAKPVGFVFHGIALGKRFLKDEAFAFRYAPGSSVQFSALPVISFGDASTPASSEREITYDEKFAFALAHRFSPQLSAGLGVRVRREEVSDTRYQIVVRDTLSYPAASRTIYAANSWLLDASVMWHPFLNLTVAGAARNLLWWRTGDAGSPLQEYYLPTKPIGDFGFAYVPLPGLLCAGNVSTTGVGSLGAEWSLPLGFALRSGVQSDSRQSGLIDAMTMGVGWSYEYFEVDAGYSLFTGANSHNGSGTQLSFDPGLLSNLDLHPYSHNRLVLSAKAAFGSVRESLARIEGITVFGSIYPAAADLLAYKPIGIVRVRNTSNRPINAKVRLFVDRIMDVPSESPSVYIAPGAETEIPLMALFNEQVKKVTALTVREGDVYVNATPAEEYDDRSQTRLVILGRNAWDGDSRSLRYFVTPDDPAVLRYSRDVLLDHRDSLANVLPLLERFAKARILINSFAGKLLYVNDPKLSADYVQYPSETLQLRGGDCDDMTVCFTSLLSSIGISTAFVDVVPPDHPEQGHIYMLCDTGVEPRYGSSLAENPKRYVVRRNAAGVETIWIPLEATAVTRGFDEAWVRGAQEYFDDVEVGLGVVKGWVRIVDVN
jgi:hypothetical protein